MYLCKLGLSSRILKGLSSERRNIFARFAKPTIQEAYWKSNQNLSEKAVQILTNWASLQVFTSYSQSSHLILTWTTWSEALKLIYTSLLMLLAGKHSDEINFTLIVDIFNNDIFNNIQTLSVIKFRGTQREKFRKRPENNNKAWIKFLGSHFTHFGRLLGKIYLFQGHSNIFSKSPSQQKFAPAWKTDILRNRSIGSPLHSRLGRSAAWRH